MRDAERERLLRLVDWRPPLGVISTYFDIDRADRGEGWRVALRDGLREIQEPQDHEGKMALRETVNRLLERFDADTEPPPGRAQIGFVEVARKPAAEDWSSLQITARETAIRHGPRPLLRPLIDLLSRGRPRPVLAISAERVRGWVWDRGHLEPERDWEAELEIYPGSERKGAQPQDPARGHAVSSSGRDQFGQRLRENRRRFLHQCARRIGDEKRFRGTELIAIGEAPYLDDFAAGLPSTLRLRKVEGPDVIGEQDGPIAERVASEIERSLLEQEAELVQAAIDAAMATGGRAAVGVNETSEALAEGRVEHLLLDFERQFPIAELSPTARERAPDGQLDGAELMIELALRTSADVTPVGREVAEALRRHGGAAALLRYEEGTLPGKREPMPHGLRPMLARLSKMPPDPDRFGFEIKWDGVRALTYVAQGSVMVQSRTGRDISAQFPEVAGLSRALGRRQAVLDGELVSFDERGRPSFQRLQGRIHLAAAAAVRERMRTIPVTLMLFDILHLSGRSTRDLPYEERRATLEALALEGPNWQTPRHHIGEGPKLLAASRKKGLEGVIAKRLGSLYEPGRRGGAWLKVKNVRGQEMVIGGWLPGRGRRFGAIGALLVGYYEGPHLRYAGKVGTGFGEEDLRRLARALAPLRRDTSPFVGRQPERGAVFVEPKLVAEVEFGEWTRAGTLRHPAFKGLRTDKRPRDVVREEAA
jgi:DNA ligase D-like protein (predicted ligase)